MAIQPRTINVEVKNDQGTPLPDAAVTLLGPGQPQFQITDAAGRGIFANLVPGGYRLLTALEGYNTMSTAVTLSGNADSTVQIELRTVDEDSSTSRSHGRFFRTLTALQYLFLATIAGIFIWLLSKGISGATFNLQNTEMARGLITYLVAVVTVSIALILVMAAFMSGGKDIDKRFAAGKEVFTILVGVLGTVMGFYYGQATPAGAAAQAPEIQITAPELTPAPKLGSQFNLAATISGGEKPYTYTITFSRPEAITPPADKLESQDGQISQKFNVNALPALANQNVTYTIAVTDKSGRQGSYDKGSLTIAP